jgi:hypothetical protein
VQAIVVRKNLTRRNSRGVCAAAPWRVSGAPPARRLVVLVPAIILAMFAGSELGVVEAKSSP